MASAGSLTVALIPSVSGGLGHVTRTLHLARALERADPSLRLVYVLSELRLRPFNVEAVERAGYPVRLLPNPVHHERDARVRAVLGDVDVVIEDTERRLVAYRRSLPRLKAWVSVPMLPIWDELFMDWPYLEQVDLVLYAYPPIMPPPPELACLGDRLCVTGPILAPEEMPSRADARRALGLAADVELITHAPRGFPFGRWFGQRVLNGVVGGFLRLRQRRPGLRLVLTAVPDTAAIQPRGLPPLDEIEGVSVEGVVPFERARAILAAADVVVVEGTSTLFDAAVARTPVLMVPGPIHETALEGTWVDEEGAGVVLRPEDVTRASMARALAQALEPGPAAERAERLHRLVGSGGRERAVSAVRRLLEQVRAGGA